MGDQLAPAVPTGSEPGRRQAQKTAALKGPRAYELEKTEPAQVGRERSYFVRWDLVAVLALAAGAMVLRFYSPIMPDFFVHPFQGTAITNWVWTPPFNPKG